MSHTMEELSRFPTILLVDDDADRIAGLSDRLMFEGFLVITAHGGLDALSCLQISQPAVILLDFHMPGMNGAETFRARPGQSSLSSYHSYDRSRPER